MIDFDGMPDVYDPNYPQRLLRLWRILTAPVRWLVTMAKK